VCTAWRVNIAAEGTAAGSRGRGWTANHVCEIPDALDEQASRLFQKMINLADSTRL
jgi:hypothetical protein